MSKTISGCVLFLLNKTIFGCILYQVIIRFDAFALFIATGTNKEEEIGDYNKTIFHFARDLLDIFINLLVYVYVFRYVG